MEDDTSAAKNNSQLACFKEVARELGCDESEAAFDEKIKAIVKVKPSLPEALRQKKNPQK